MATGNISLKNFPIKYAKAAIIYTAMQITLKRIGQVMEEYALTKGEAGTNFISEEDPEMASVVTQRGISEANWLTAKYTALRSEYMAFFGSAVAQQQSQQQGGKQQ